MEFTVKGRENEGIPDRWVCPYCHGAGKVWGSGVNVSQDSSESMHVCKVCWGKGFVRVSPMEN